MTDYTTKPRQFRLPPWAHEFLARESAERGVSKTEVILDALETLKRTRFEEAMADGYREMAEFDAQEIGVWDCTLADGLEDQEW